MYGEENYIHVKAEAFESMVPSKRFSETSNKLIELAYSEDQWGLIVSAEDVILIYNLKDGSKAKPIECKKYGVDRVEYLTNDTCVHSDPNDGIVRILNISKKSYIRYFHGHTQKIRAIRSYPHQREKFMTSSLDGHIRMFDSRANDNFGLINMCSTPLIAFDPDGILFAVATRSCSIKLFDIRSFDLGPFKTFKLQTTDEEWTDIEFSPCGKFILISTKNSGIKWLDAFDGHIINTFSAHKNPQLFPLRASISNDSAFVAVGSGDRHIYVYSTQTGSIACKLPTPYQEPSHVVAINHRQFLMTSLGRDVILWAPNEEYIST